MQCALCQPTACEILWQDDFCRVVLLGDRDYPAYCRVELIEHVKEMTDLAPQARAHTMKVVFAVESAIRSVIQPDKINLASLGNKTPHVHWHVIPRFEMDQHFPNSHWGQVVREYAADVLSNDTISALKISLHTNIACALAN